MILNGQRVTQVPVEIPDGEVVRGTIELLLQAAGCRGADSGYTIEKESIMHTVDDRIGPEFVRKATEAELSSYQLAMSLKAWLQSKPVVSLKGLYV